MLNWRGGAVRRSRQSWFVAHCRSSQELSAQERLEQQGFGVYLPLVRSVRRDALAPLFPCYMFVRFDPLKQSAAVIRATRGVVGLVRFGSVNAVVPDAIVAALRQMEDEDGVHAGVERGFEVGELVRLKDGPLAGLLARVAERDGGGRIVLLMDVLGRVNRLSVLRSDVERA